MYRHLHVIGTRGVYIFAQLSVIMALGKLGGPEVLGVYGACLAIIIPAMSFGGLGFRQELMTRTDDDIRFGVYELARKCVSALACIPVLIILAFQNSLLAYVIGGCLLVAKLAESQMELLYAYLQWLGRDGLGAAIMSIRLVLGAIGFCVSLYVFRSVGLSFLIYTLIWVCSYLVSGWYLRKINVIPENNSASLVEAFSLIKAGFFVSAVVALSMLIHGLPRLGALALLDLKAAGYITAIMMPVQAIGQVLNSIAQREGVSIAKHVKEKAWSRVWASMRIATASTLGVGVSFLVLCVWKGELILSLLYSDEYTSLYSLLVAMAAATVLRSLAAVVYAAAMSTRNFASCFVGSSITAILAVVALLYFLPLYGLWGVMYAYVFSIIAQFFIMGAVFVREVRSEREVVV